MKQLLGITVLLVVLAAPVGATHLPRTDPDPSLSPHDVVRIQIEALQHNDTPYEDRGIEVTFNFASPTNKRMTGPLERFKLMVRNPVYGPMIDHRSAEYQNVKVEGDFAQVDVILESKDGQSRWTLRRVPDGRGVGPFLLGCRSILGDLNTEPEGIIDIPRRRGDL